MDCGLSIFKQYFAAGSDYSYDLEHIGNYYKGYLNLMDHWNIALPDRILSVQYEKLLDNFSDSVEDMLAFIGVDFEEACLKFHQTKRAVRTASSEQVRQPIHNKSWGLWKNIQEDLHPLKATLGPDILKRFDTYLN